MSEAAMLTSEEYCNTCMYKCTLVFPTAFLFCYSFNSVTVVTILTTLSTNTAVEDVKKLTELKDFPNRVEDSLPTAIHLHPGGVEQPPKLLPSIVSPNQIRSFLS